MSVAKPSPNRLFWDISGLDIEVHWLADSESEWALIPPSEALYGIRKPSILAADKLPLKVPDWLSVNVSRIDKQRYCEDAGWDIWVKGQYYDARRSRSWTQVCYNIDDLQAIWGTDHDIFLQRHIPGREVSFAFAAYQGRLLDAIYMEKQQVTVEGKTWSGTIIECPVMMKESLVAVVKELNWSGGGEIECVRDHSGQLWLIDWNPRFPAWLHGATLAGHNMVSALVQAATAVQARPSPLVSSQFTRTVSEIPVDYLRPLPSLPVLDLQTEGNEGPPKHPSGMPQLMPTRTVNITHQHRFGTSHKSDRYIRYIVHSGALYCATPMRLFISELAKESMDRVVNTANKVTKQSGVRVCPAYSIKTNPSSDIVELALKYGFLAEIISVDEARHAQRIGFTADQMIHNGPIPAESVDAKEPYRAVFADSIRSFDQLFDKEIAQVNGARLRPIGIDSRFGIEMADPASFRSTIDIIRRLPIDSLIGFSFHYQSSTIGMTKWMDAVSDVIQAIHEMERLSDHSVSLLDIGGGWTPSGLYRFLNEGLRHLVDITRQELISVREVIIEPGKGVAERSAFVVASILEIRSSAVVLDASICEIPHARQVARPIIAMSKRGQVKILSDGDTQLLGRLCMEDDLLSDGVEVPDWLREGDRICFGSCGAYDASMSYLFGRGDLCS